MRRKTHKLFWIWNFEKEEKWLNEMSAKGLQLISVGFGTYEFEDGNPGEYQYKLEFLKNRSTDIESIHYIKFLEESNIKYIGNVGRWVYFAINSNDGRVDIYSDMDSQIQHLKRIYTFIGIIFYINMFAAINNLFIYFSSIQGIKLNLILGILNAILAFFIAKGFIKIRRVIGKLEKERALRE